MKKLFQIFALIGAFVSLFAFNPVSHVQNDSRSIENLKHCGASGVQPFNEDDNQTRLV